MPELKEIKSVGVIGAGTIGASWASLFLASGFSVKLYDPSPDAEGFVRDYVDHAWPALEELGMVKSTQWPGLTFVSTPEDAASDVDFIQESVPERIEIKHDLFRRIEPHMKADCIIASSASGLLVKEMQAGFQNPGRLILGHPFNPPHLIPLVELLVNEKTDDDVMPRAEGFYAACSKVTIRVEKEVPGHVANRLQAALWREAIHLVNEGVASVEDVDKAVHAGPGLRWSVMGPHMLFNLGSGGHGLGVFCERFGPSFHRWWDDLGDPRLTPDIGAKLFEGVQREENGRTFDQLAAERDSKIVAALKAMQAVSLEEDKPVAMRKVTAR